MRGKGQCVQLHSPRPQPPCSCWCPHERSCPLCAICCAPAHSTPLATDQACPPAYLFIRLNAGEMSLASISPHLSPLIEHLQGKISCFIALTRSHIGAMLLVLSRVYLFSISPHPTFHLMTRPLAGGGRQPLNRTLACCTCCLLCCVAMKQKSYEALALFRIRPEFALLFPPANVLIDILF